MAHAAGLLRLLDETHPGEILLEEFMKPMAISARKLAADIDVSPSRISDRVHGQQVALPVLGAAHTLLDRFRIADHHGQ